MKRKCLTGTILTLILWLSICFHSCENYYTTPNEFLKSLQITNLDTVVVDSPFVIGYSFQLAQPLDHNHPEKDTLFQRIFWSHRGMDKPVVMITEGYNHWSNHRREITQMLDANQIVVEHRYFGKSIPDSMDYRYLTAEQAAADHHAIIQLFKKLYRGKWVTTGRSKGGQTTIYHRVLFPKDVVASVPYVAPFNSAQEDPQIDEFIRSMGSEQCREKIRKFQQSILKRRDQMVAMLIRYRQEQKFEFPFADDRILEYAVLEYPFTFWQWRSFPCDSIPEGEISDKKLFDHLKKIIPFKHYYSAENVKKQYAAFYQFMTQLGYYGYNYNHSDVMKLLRAEPHPTNRVFGPPGVDLSFKPELMNRVRQWIRMEGNRVIYVYGGKDPWSATSAQFSRRVDALKLVLESGNHAVHLRDFPMEEQEAVRKKLVKWLGIPVQLPDQKKE